MVAKISKPRCYRLVLLHSYPLIRYVHRLINMALSIPRVAARSLFALVRPSSSVLRSRSYATETKLDFSTIERTSDEVDVCIVGGGPAGLSAAIRLKQLEKENGGEELRVVVLEKGGEVGQSVSNRDILRLYRRSGKG